MDGCIAQSELIQGSGAGNWGFLAEWAIHQFQLLSRIFFMTTEGAESNGGEATDAAMALAAMTSMAPSPPQATRRGAWIFLMALQAAEVCIGFSHRRKQFLNVFCAWMLSGSGGYTVPRP
eukprot:1153231-Pelagomonas_calceolata.AAC.9